MSRTGALLASDAVDRYRSVGAFGKPVYQSHVQLRGVLQGRRQPRLSQYFSRPVHDAETGALHWYAEQPGTVRRLSELTAPQQQAGLHALREIKDALDALTLSLRAGASTQAGASGAMASLLDQARRVPAQSDFLYFVDDQPVIAFWGFEDASGSSTDPAAHTLAAAAAPKAVAASAPVAVAAAALAPDPAQAASSAAAASLGPRWWWLVPALLGLLAAGWAMRSCAPQAVPAVPLLPAQAETLQIPPGALARGDLSFLQGQWQLGADRLEEYRDGPGNVVGSGRNVLEFGRDGTGRAHFLDRQRHGKGASSGTPYPSCDGGLKASIQGEVLVILQDDCIVRAGKGDGMGGSRAECRRTDEGTTLCENVNTTDKHRWRAELRRIAVRP